MRRQWIAIVLSLGLLGGILLHYASRTPNTETQADRRPFPQMLKHASAAATVSPLIDSAEDRPAQALLLIFEDLQGNFNNSINRDLVEEKVFTQIAQRSAWSETLRKVLHDHDYAIQEFGSKQALARVYAIKYLRYRLMQGEAAEISATIKTLTTGFSQSLEAKRSLPHAQLRDLEDLLRIYEAHMSLEWSAASDHELIEYLRNLLVDCGLNSMLHPTVKEVFDDALFINLKNRLGRQRAARIVGEVLQIFN